MCLLLNVIANQTGSQYSRRWVQETSMLMMDLHEKELCQCGEKGVRGRSPN